MQSVVSALLSALFMLLTPEVIKKFVDAGLDIIEDAVANSSNKIDDVVVIPLCKKLREALSIPDDDAPSL